MNASVNRGEVGACAPCVEDSADDARLTPILNALRQTLSVLSRINVSVNIKTESLFGTNPASNKPEQPGTEASQPVVVDMACSIDEAYNLASSIETKIDELFQKLS